jgi:hypothetical protein
MASALAEPASILCASSVALSVFRPDMDRQ